MSDDHVGTRLTRRRLLGGVATIGVAGALGGVSTMARFRDEETSSVSVQAGTFDLTLSDGDEGFGEGGDSVSVTLPTVKPGDKVWYDIILQNAGSVEADHVELGFSYDVTESSGPNGNDEADTQPDATGMAKQFEVTELSYDAPLLPSLGDPNGNGRFDIADLSSGTNEGVLDNLTPPPSANGGTKVLGTGFQFAHDPSNNDYQGDELTLTITFALHQTSGQDI